MLNYFNHFLTISTVVFHKLPRSWRSLKSWLVFPQVLRSCGPPSSHQWSLQQGGGPPVLSAHRVTISRCQLQGAHYETGPTPQDCHLWPPFWWSPFPLSWCYPPMWQQMHFSPSCCFPLSATGHSSPHLQACLPAFSQTSTRPPSWLWQPAVASFPLFPLGWSLLDAA